MHWLLHGEIGIKHQMCELIYNKCSKILNTFFFLFFNKMMVIGAEIHKMLVRIANREGPDQTAS